MSHIAYINGLYEPNKNALINIEDRGLQFSDGVYEVIYVWNETPVDYGAHIERLSRSLNELNIPAPMSWRSLTVIIKEVIRRNYLRQGIIYIQISRGVASRTHGYSREMEPSLVVTAKFTAPPSEEIVKKGVKVLSTPDIRWARRDIKSISLLPNIIAKQSALDVKAFESVFYKSDGSVTEASASNVWIVDKDKTLITHPTSRDILGGVTRATILKLARDAGYRISEQSFTLQNMHVADEVFLTGTTTFVMPVVQVDKHTIANGYPGECALELRDRYIQYIKDVDPVMAWNV